MNTQLLEKYDVKPFENPAETEYFIKYLEQGERKGLEGLANVVYARTSTSELFKTLPHLKTKYADKPVPKVLKVAKVKADKVAKAPKVKVAKPDLKDGMVFFRADRNKWMAVLGGKAVAARDTQEKALEFLAKKGVEGYVVTE